MVTSKRYLNKAFIDEPLSKESIAKLGTVYTVNELAMRLNYSTSQIRRMRKLGRFKASGKIGGIWYIVP